jgi:hypothetical protein
MSGKIVTRPRLTRTQFAIAAAAVLALVVFFHPILAALIWIRNLGLFLASLSAD